MPLAAGQIVDRYEVERALGSTAEGERYLVRHVRLRTRYELLVGPELAPVDAAARLEQVRARAALVHPNLVRVVDWLDVDGVPALVREHWDQPTLADRLAAGALRPDEAVAIARIVVLLLATGADQGVPVGVPGPDQVWLGEGGPRIVAGAPAGSLLDLLDRLIAAAPDPRLAELRADAARMGPRELWDARFGGARVAVEAAYAPGPAAPTWISGVSAPRTLPSPRRALVGRDAAVSALLGALEGDGALVTVVGTAGVGKTRLAIEVAQRYTDGPVVFADLQAAATVEAALSAIAWALGTDRDSLDAVVPALEAQPYLLLVLDNVEQLPPAFADLLGRIRADARRLRILTTSRHRLGLPDEWAYPLEPLPVPASATELADSPAFALLALIAPGTALRSADPDRVVALLQALEGLPLAVELAAARLEILEVDELVARLDDRFAVLSDPHDSGERHGSLLAALDASWGLLAPDERRLLTHLSSFVAPFSADLVERVTDLPEPRPILDRLAARSLVVRRGPRFLLLVAVRAFADRKLAPDERRALYLRHAAAWAEVARALRRDTAGYREAWRRMTESAPEFSAVLDRARTDPALVGPALACAVPLIHLALRRGPLPRALELAESAVTRVREPTDHLAGWCDLRILQALALRRLGRTEEGAPILAALLARDDLPPEYRATAHAHLADAATDLDDLALAEHHSEAGLRLAREHGPAGLVATLQANLAAYAAYRGEAGSAFERFEAALASVPPGDRVTELEVLKQYAWARLLLDDVPGAEVLLQRIRELAAEIDDRRSLATAAGQLGLCAEVQGALARAEASYEEAVALMTGQREQRMRAFYDAGIGRLWLRRGREREGLDRIERSGAIDLDGMGTAELRLTWAIGAVAVGRVEEVRQVRLERGEEAVRALIEARTALDRLDRAGATAALARFDRELPPIEPHARAAVVAVVGQLRDEVDAWWIAGDGRWIEAPDGPRVDTERPAASARILARLARERVERPGRALDAATLADAGWPGERLVDKAASNRVSVALTGLRKVGLDALLVRDEAGWMLDPGAPVRLGVGPG